MKTFNSFLRPLKFVAIAFTFVTLIWANATPAFAFGSSPSSPTDGEVSLTQVEKMSEKALQSKPRSAKEVSAVAKGGLNGVQGAADQDKMIQPGDAPEATTVKDDIESGIKSMLGQD